MRSGAPPYRIASTLPFTAAVGSPKLTATNTNANTLYNRRHSVDVVYRPLTTMAPVAAGAVPLGGSGATAATVPNRWYVEQDRPQPGGGCSGRAGAPYRGSADLPRRLGPRPFGSPIGALGPAVGTGCTGDPDDGAARDGVGGGLDIARMLARASELVAVTQASSISGGGASGSVDRAGSSIGSGTQPPSPRSAIVYNDVFFSGASPNGSMTTPVLVSSAAAVTTFDQPLGTADVIGESAGQAMYIPTAVEYLKQPFHHPSNQTHHHLSTSPYGMTTAVHVTRLDPVEEGCGSSTALTVEASSSSALGSRALNLCLASDAPVVAVVATTAATPVLGRRVGAVVVGVTRHSADEYRRRDATATTLVAAVEASLSNSGPRYSGARGMSGSSHSESSHGSASMPQHTQGGSASAARWNDARGGVGGVSGRSASTAAAPPLVSPAKRSLFMMLKKVKNALRSGGGGGGRGRGGQ